MSLQYSISRTRVYAPMILVSVFKVTLAPDSFRFKFKLPKIVKNRIGTDCAQVIFESDKFPARMVGASKFRMNRRFKFCLKERAVRFQG